MKRIQEIVGLPIISIFDGNVMGQVEDVVFNADRGVMDYILVDSGVQFSGKRVIPAQSILGISDYALTIENEQVLTDINKVPQALELIQKNIQVRNTKVMTKKGRMIGETGDIYIDEDDSCKISALEFLPTKTPDAVYLIPRKDVLTFGKSLIVVAEDVEISLMDEIPKTKVENYEEKKN